MIGGILPESWFPERPSSRKVEMLKIDGGISPVRLFNLKYNLPRLADCPNSGGIPPVIWFASMNTPSKRGSCPSSGGILPENLFLLKWRITKLDIFPMEGGITPVKLPSYCSIGKGIEAP